ncbi:hypothetical protein [Streptomyces avermitilis]
MTSTLRTEDQQALVETTLDFAQDHLAPRALDRSCASSWPAA